MYSAVIWKKCKWWNQTLAEAISKQNVEGEN